MQSDCVRKVCVSFLAILVVTQTAAHLDRLLSQEVLDYIGYYDNLVLPVHLHARLVNLHVTRSAQRLSQHEIAATEGQTNRRYREAQYLLFHWTSWLDSLNREQCRLLLAYKSAAEAIRSNLTRRSSIGLFATNDPISGPSDSISSSYQDRPDHSETVRPTLTSYSPLKATAVSRLMLQMMEPPPKVTQDATIFSPSGPGDRTSGSITLPHEAFVPRHCRASPAQRNRELAKLRRLNPPTCPIDVITPRLFKE
ncbi:unnamed protein product [Protopolystoma xenopodis]|uniref:Uncharacterized protein n=1 Tax=Protopolystoma xenopodis TaxID=117903 RepID=A0A448WA21_9PLAT|nr:unnamed protein product [Protopolystoma xenopodis]